MSSEFWRSSARQLLVPVLGFVVITPVAALILWLTIPARPVPINVRWTADVTEQERAALEQALGLRHGDHREGTTWAYRLEDFSTDRIRAIVQHPRVDDTAQVNRLRFRPSFEYDRPRRILVFSVAIGVAVTVVLGARRMLTVARMPVSVSPSALTALVVAPSAAVAGAAAVFLLLAALGFDPFWEERIDVSLPQAAAVGDHVMVFKLVGQGIDPNAAGPVSLDGRVLTLTPLEAAVLSRDVETLVLLAERGALIDSATRARLTCLAEEVEAGDVAGFLKRGQPDAPDCARVTLPAH